jgi:GNAT superfamily N-acetyltransferase
MQDFKIYISNKDFLKYSQIICDQIESSAKERGTGIARRPEEYIRKKIESGHAIICLSKDEHFAGFCYIEKWSSANYVANSGLIVHPDYRKMGLGKEIKKKAFELSRKLYPKAKLFGLTTNLAVMHINSELGYRPVTFSELTQDDQFWDGCSSCVNYDILNRMKRVHCLCTGMLYDPKRSPNNGKKLKIKGLRIYDRWIRFKKHVLLKGIPKSKDNK